MKAIRKGLGTPRDIAAFSMLPLNSSWGELQDPASMEGRSMARQSKDNDCLGLKACKWPQGCVFFLQSVTRVQCGAGCHLVWTLKKIIRRKQ